MIFIAVGQEVNTLDKFVVVHELEFAMKRALQVDNRYKIDLRIERKASIFIKLLIKSVYGIFFI